MKKIAYLGPEGSFSHEVAETVQRREQRKTGTEWGLEPLVSWEAIAGSVSNGESDLGIMVHYNLIDDVEQPALDQIFKHGLHVIDAIRLPIVWHAAVSPGSTDRSKIYSHRKGIGQTAEWRLREYPKAVPIETASTGAAAQKVAETREGIALASERAVLKYGLEVIAEDVGDKLHSGTNYTDFYAVSKTQNGVHHGEYPYQTLAALIPRVDRVGLLHEITGHLKNSHINLSDLRSRTAPHILNGNCKGVPLMFYIEADCHCKDFSFIEAVSKIKDMLKDPRDPDKETVRIIGSYKKPTMPFN